MAFKRKLTTIPSADVVGYSRLINSTFILEETLTLMGKNMNNQNSSKTTMNRSILDHILYPNPTDIIVVRIFFWVSIIICMILPRYFEGLAHNQAWNVIFIVWLALAIALRIMVYIRAKT